jgi:hypothetical protein
MSKKNILFLCHVEEMFRAYFPDKMYVNRLIRGCQSSKYDKVIALISCINDWEPIAEIKDLVTSTIDFSWGYEPEQFENEPSEEPWLIEASHKSLHEYTWIPPELRDSTFAHNANIFIGGGCDGECLADFEVVLEHLGVDYTRVEGYIYKA